MTAAPIAAPPVPVAKRAWNGRQATSEMYDITLDPDGFVLCSTRGFWTVADVDAYFTLLKQVLAECRARYGRVRVLSDSRNSLVQAAEVAARFASFHDLLDGRYDKLALVAGSMLRMRQMQRALPGPYCRVFRSCEEARAWLTSSS